MFVRDRKHLHGFWICGLRTFNQALPSLCDTWPQGFVSGMALISRIVSPPPQPRSGSEHPRSAPIRESTNPFTRQARAAAGN
jgi:hypothetical protein